MAIVEWCDANDILVDGSPGGCTFNKGAHAARGCKPRRADLIIFEPGLDGTHGLAVELKVGTNTVSDVQKQWLARFARRGYRSEVLVAADGSDAARKDAVERFAQLVREHMLGKGDGSEAVPLELD